MRWHLLIMFLLTSINANAGDFASREIIGFSKDGSLFAFEEYGVQDGSGFPYSNIYLINTKTDKWVSGSPWRVQLQDDDKTVDDARQASREQAGVTLDIIVQKGFLAATNSHTELSPDPSRIAAYPRPIVPSNDYNLEYYLKTFVAEGPDYCDDFGTVKGFQLFQTYPTNEKKTRLLHKDHHKLPSSRNCALNYRFADIVTYFPMDYGIEAPAIAAVIILYERVGFEGPDGRYIAVTATID